MFKRAFVLLALGAVACSSTDTTTTVPTQPSSFAPPNVIELFTGTLTTSGTDSLTFKSLDPAPNPAVTLNLAIGLPSSAVVGQCATIQTVSVTPGTTPQITGHALAGDFCVSLTDPGNLTRSETYTVVVAHP
jgi:hypothetical protein